MLTRPLAYKGPTDHLTQFFELPQLYRGMKLLLRDLLMDWQYQKDEQQVKGFFLFKDKLVKTCISWPLVVENYIGYCDCQSKESNRQSCDSAKYYSGPGCVHLAALAIATKTELDRLPQSIKQVEAFESEWHYLTDWLSHQSFDPFPNMARHRVIYLLDGQADNIHVSVHKGYLTQQNEFQRKADLALNLVAKDKLPKFVSLTDQQIIHQINRLRSTHSHLARESNGLYLSLQENRSLLEMIVASGRCFWRTSHRHPLIYCQEIEFQPEWWHVTDQLYLDRSKSRLVDIKPITKNSAAQFFERIANGEVSHGENLWQPCFDISSKQIALEWAKYSVEIDFAKISFYDGMNEVTLQDLLAYASRSPSRQNLATLESIAARVHQLDWLPSVAAHFEQPISQHIDIGDRLLSGEFAHWLPLFRGLQLEGWRVTINRQFRFNQKHVDDWYTKISLVSPSAPAEKSSPGFLENKWFDLEVGIKVDGQSINIMPYVVKALQQGIWDFNTKENQSPVQELILSLEDGSRVTLVYERVKNILNTLLELYDTKPLTKNNKLRLPSSQFPRLISLQQQTSQITDWQEAEWLKQKAEKLAQGRGIIQVAVPDNVNATLRDYQRDGLNWLQFLTREDLCGILADDMGLGKTLQTLAHIQCEKNNGKMQGPCMVVAPTSLLGNWFAEAARFTPDLKTVSWAGSQRGLSLEKLSGADLIITSYGILLRDAELLNRQEIHLLALDEAQAIKNAGSKVTRIAFAMQSKHRLCLTGTPLENHLGELWSLFHFLMPGFLGDEAQFKRLFRIPIEKDQDFLRQKELAERIAPFMLRRTKDKVAGDLPAKTVIEELIDLDESQADIYETVRLSMLEEVQKAITNSGVARNQLLIGNALLRLRQICCHPKLIDKLQIRETGKFNNGSQQANDQHITQPETRPLITPFQREDLAQSEGEVNSAKLTWLISVLPEMIQNGRKILIFSSFTSMLSIIADKLDELSISYISLTGQTKKRSELVEKFQEGSVPVFLISLKAGGAGLNLTQADTVIHYDPWWNPAAENQASDRAHRIGQDKPVFVYKLITKGTVEERINQMQHQKSQLAEELYRVNKKQIPVTKPDWEALLAPLDDDN